MPEIRTGLIVLLLAIIPIPVASRAENISKESLKLARAELSNEIENGSIAGGAHMVVHDGQVLHFEIAGVSDIEDQTPLATDTIMRIYSMTKPITSATAMTLHEQGKFNGKRVLKESTIALMFTDQLNGVNDDFKFGLGFAIGEVTLGSGDAQRKATYYTWEGYAKTRVILVPEAKLHQIFMRQTVLSTRLVAPRLFSIVYQGIE